MFANHPGGGFFVFGVNNDGVPVGVRHHYYPEILKRLGNIARGSVVASVAIDHSILDYQGKELLFIYVPESPDKPIYARGGTFYDSYTRSAGQTREITRQEVARLIASSSSSRMSNQTIRERFQIGENNYPMASRIIADTIEAKLIKPAEA